MHDGSIVKFDGELYKKVEGQWVLLVADTSVWYPDGWMMDRVFDVIQEADPLSDLEVGTIIAGPRSFEAAVYSGNGRWFMTGFTDWISSGEVLEFFGDGWKVVYKAGENDA